MIDFVCMANDAYLRWLELCVEAINRSHPRSAIHVFDLSDTPGTIRAFAAKNANVRHVHFPPSQWRWPAWIDGAGFDFIWPNFGLREHLKYYSRKLRTRLGAHNENWMTDKAAHTARVRRSLRIYAQKPYVIRASLQASANNLVFIDVDAMALKPLEAVFDLDFDLGVTAEAPQDVIVGPEPPECTDRPPYPYKAINVGVIFVRNSKAMEPLLQAWIEEMESVRHLSIEQTALANLILRLAPGFFESHYRSHLLRLPGGASTSVMSLPMKLYNFTRIRHSDTRLAPEPFVAHFCGGKKQVQHWEWVHKMISERLELIR